MVWWLQGRAALWVVNGYPFLEQICIGLALCAVCRSFPIRQQPCASLEGAGAVCLLFLSFFLYLFILYNSKGLLRKGFVPFWGDIERYIERHIERYIERHIDPLLCLPSGGAHRQHTARALCTPSGGTHRAARATALPCGFGAVRCSLCPPMCVEPVA